MIFIRPSDKNDKNLSAANDSFPLGYTKICREGAVNPVAAKRCFAGLTALSRQIKSKAMGMNISVLRGFVVGDEVVAVLGEPVACLGHVLLGKGSCNGIHDYHGDFVEACDEDCFAAV